MRRVALLGVIAIALLAGGARAAGELTLTVVSQNSSTITLGWTPQSGYGYLFSTQASAGAPLVLVSRTNDASRSSVKFSKTYSYEVAVITKGQTGVYPTVPPPPPKNQCEDAVDNDGDGKIDYPADPGCTSATDNDETDPAPTGAANVWMSPSGNDSTCARANSSLPCLTLNRAYQIAQAGDNVEIRAGTYSQSATINAASKAGSDTNRVTFHPAAGAAVTFSQQLVIESSFVKVDGSPGSLRLGTSLKIQGGAKYVTIAHADARGEQSQIYASDHATLTDVKMGGFCYAGAPGADALNIGGGPTNVVVEDSEIGDICYFPPEHPDCVAVFGVNGLVFRRNKVFWCGTQGLYTASDFGEPINNLLIENNWFSDLTRPGQSDAYYILQLDDGTNITVRYNSFGTGVDGGINLSVQGPISVYGNAGQLDGCVGGVSYAYNVWTNAKCSATDITADPLFVQSAGGPSMDLSLRPGSPAIGRGDPSRFPATDIFGRVRTSPPDAGATQH